MKLLKNTAVEEKLEDTYSQATESLVYYHNGNEDNDLNKSIGFYKDSQDGSSSSSSFDENSKSSTFVSILNLSQQFIGAGLLSIPWAISKGSLYPAIIVIIFNSIYDMITAIFIVNGCEKTNIFEYSSLLRSIGPKWEFISAVSIMYVAGSTLVTFLILIADFIENILSFDFKYHRQLYIITVVLAVILPLSLLKSLRALKYWSILCNFANFYCVGLLLYLAIYNILFEHHSIPNDSSADINYYKLDFGLFILNNIAAKSFVVHMSIPNMYQELQNRSVPKFMFIFACANVIVLILYLTFGVCGYLLYGNNVHSDITNNLEHNHYTIIARIAMTISIMGTYPFVFKALFTTFSNKFCKKQVKQSETFRSLAIIGLVLTTMIVPLLVEDVGIVSSLEGAVSVLGILCIFPIAIVWKMGFVSGINTDKHSNDIPYSSLTYSQKISNITSCQKLVLVIMLVIGIVLGCAGIYAEINDLI